MPRDSILKPIIIDAQARLLSHRSPVQEILGIVRLWHGIARPQKLADVARPRPRLTWPPGWGGVGGRNDLTRAGPKPAPDAPGLQVRSVTALEVAEAARGP